MSECGRRLGGGEARRKCKAKEVVAAAKALQWQSGV